VVHLLQQVGEKVALPEEPIGLRLHHYRLRADQLPFSSEPAVSPPVDSSLDLSLSLVGCALPQQVRGDEESRFGCYWEAQDALPHHLSVSVRLLDAAGAEWGRADTAISGPYLVAARWPLGEPVMGQYTLHPFPGIPPGDFYRLELWVYEPGGAGHGAVTAGSLAIDRPSSPFTMTLPANWTGGGRLGGLVLEGASVRPEQALPGEEVWVEALWRVAGPFHEPRLALEGSSDQVSLLPMPGATGAWEVGDRYRTITRLPLSPHAPGGLANLRAVSHEEAILVGTVHVDVTRTFTLPLEVQPLDYQLGDAIALVGAQLDSSLPIEETEGEATSPPELGGTEGGPASPPELGGTEGGPTEGGTVQVVLYWQAKTFIDRSYTVFVHLVGPDGQIHAQADALPQAGRHPTTHWLPGEVVADPYQLEWPCGAPSGEYRVLAGLYDLTTLDRLPVTDADGDPVPDNMILIGSWEVP